MPVITLPDGSQRSFDNPLPAIDIVRSISAELAEAALTVQINDQPVDLSHLVTAVRTRKGNDLGSMSLTAFTEQLHADLLQRGRLTD